MQLLKRLEQVDVVALDTETDGLHRFCEVVGFSVAVSSDEGYYVPYKIYSPELGLYCPWEQPDIIAEVLRTICKKKLVLHNAQYDQKAIMNTFGIYFLDNLICDTLCLAHTVYREERPLGLKDLAAELLDPNAKAPQDDVKASVKANGGSTTKTKFEMYKCDYEVLGRYAAYDTMYTYGLYEKLFPEIEKQGFQDLWYNEVMPLIPVTYRMNTTGVRIDVPYFEKLKVDMLNKINQLEAEIYNEYKTELFQYEVAKLKREVKVTPTSAFGKHLVQIGKATVAGKGKEKTFTLNSNIDLDLYQWWCTKEQQEKVFNIDSGDDKAHLIYTILELPCDKMTDSGKRSVDASTIETLAKEYEDRAPILGKILERAGEQKLLNTYVESLLENHVEGRIYTTFNQTGTTGGRYSSSEPINLQTLPRDDKRIKKGFIPDDGWVFIGDDYSSLEPRIFAHMSGEDRIRQVYKDNLDLYSQIAIDVFGVKNVSAKEDDANYLKKVNPTLRQASKTFSLAVIYGAGPGRIANALGVPYEEATDIIEKYMQAYPSLKEWMEHVDAQILAQGFVRNIVGRKRRAGLMHTLATKYGVSDFSKKGIERFWKRNMGYQGFESPGDLFYACKNNKDNAKNFLIQSVGASVMNRATIKFCQTLPKHLNAKVLLQVHDALYITCPKEQAEEVAKHLQYCMENHPLKDKLSVSMEAVPQIAYNNIAEAG